MESSGLLEEKDSMINNLKKEVEDLNATIIKNAEILEYREIVINSLKAEIASLKATIETSRY